MPTITIKHEILVHALSSRIWKVLTSSHYTRQFLFSCELMSDWTQGSMVHAANDETACGIVEEVVPGLRLRFRLLLPNYTGLPVQFLFELKPGDNGVQLDLVQELENRDVPFKDLDAYGRMILQKIKWLAEYG